MRNNSSRGTIIGFILILLFMILVIITFIVCAVLLAFKIHTLVGIMMICALIYYIFDKFKNYI